MRKGDITIQYTFLIFIGMIAVFVIVGLLATWALDAKQYMCIFTGECKIQDGSLVDIKSIEVRSAASFDNAVIKYAKICYEDAKSGKVHGDLCYGIKCVDCETRCNEAIQKAIERSLGDNYECHADILSDKMLIGFDYSKQKVWVK